MSLRRANARAGWHLLRCGRAGAADELAGIARQYADLVTVHQLSATAAPDVLHDPDGRALHRLGLRSGDTARYLVRPTGTSGTDPADPIRPDSSDTCATG